MIVVLQNTKTGEYSDGKYGWTMKLEEAQRWHAETLIPSHDHIMFVELKQERNKEMTVDDVVALYVRLRNEKGAIRAQADEAVSKIDAKLDKLEAWIKTKADEQGVTSFKTNHGTAFLTTVDYASVENWDAMLKFVKDNDAFDMFEKRVSKTAVRGYIDAHKQVPSGVTYGTRIEVSVRKPTKKVEAA